jgi:hypothetical protein
VLRNGNKKRVGDSRRGNFKRRGVIEGASIKHTYKQFFYLNNYGGLSFKKNLL